MSTRPWFLGLHHVALALVVCGMALAAASAPASPGHACVRGAELWFRTPDGTTLVGHRFGGKRPGGRTAVVLAHMSEGDLCQWVPFARRLAARGVFAFPFDFRGHGFSKGRTAYGRLGSDVAAAVRAVRRLGARRVVVVGASLGGIAALVAAPRISPPLAGVAAVSAPATIAGELDALASAPRIAVPALFVAAQDDRSSSYDFRADARRLWRATGTSEKRLELVPGALHGVFLVDASSRVRALLERFLRDPRGTVAS